MINLHNIRYEKYILSFYRTCGEKSGLRTGGELATGRDSTDVGTIRTEFGFQSTSDGVINWSWCGSGSWGEGFGETAAIGGVAAAGVAFHNGIVFGTIIKRVDRWCLVFEIQVEESGY